jgi:hypothetical protein
MGRPRSPFPKWWILDAAAQVGLTKVEMADGWTQVGLPAVEGRGGSTRLCPMIAPDAGITGQRGELLGRCPHPSPIPAQSRGGQPYFTTSAGAITPLSFAVSTLLVSISNSTVPAGPL